MCNTFPTDLRLVYVYYPGSKSNFSYSFLFIIVDWYQATIGLKYCQFFLFSSLHIILSKHVQVVRRVHLEIANSSSSEVNYYAGDTYVRVRTIPIIARTFSGF